MRILNDADHVSEWVCHTGNANAFANILHWAMRRRAQLKKAVARGLAIGHFPITCYATRADGDAGHIRIKTKLVAANVEANIERLIEIRLDPEHRAVPRLRLV